MLRVNAPMSFGLLHLSPLIPEFLGRWPSLSLDVGFTDRFIDLVEEGVDLGVRIASSLPDSATLVVQRLARARHMLVASPAYVRAHGEPKTLDDLARHSCIVYSSSRTPGVWEFVERDVPRRVTIHGPLVLNNSLAIRDAVLAGVGVSLLPSFYVEPALRQRRLRVLLPDQESPPLVVYAAYQRSRHLSAKVRLFSEFLRDRFLRAEWAVRDK